MLKKIVETDNITNVIDSLRDEMEKSREHELKLFQMITARSQQPHQEYSHQTMTHNVPSLSSQFSQVNQQPSTAFINQGFHSNLQVLQPVI